MDDGITNFALDVSQEREDICGYSHTSVSRGPNDVRVTMSLTSRSCPCQEGNIINQILGYDYLPFHTAFRKIRLCI